MTDKVRVYINTKHRIALSIFTEGARDEAGVSFMRRTQTVDFEPGVNEGVSKDFIELWKRQHEKSPLVELLTVLD